MKQRILVTGGTGFLGSHVVKALERSKTWDRITFDAVRGNRVLDLVNREDCKTLVEFYQPDVIIHCAALVGGIGANQQRPAEFFYDNLMMGAQLMHEAYRAGVKKFVNIGSICMYPEVPPNVPFREEDIHAGYPEKTNASYGIAKRALMEMGRAYRAQYDFNVITLIPANLYGPGDSFDPDRSHVIPALIRRFVEAKEDGRAEVVVWGTGNATRDFLYIDDAAEAVALATERYDHPAPMNLSGRSELSIRDLANAIAYYVGYDGRIVFDPSKPDGQPRRSVDWTRAGEALSWYPTTRIEDGLKATVEWYLEQRASSPGY